MKKITFLLFCTMLVSTLCAQKLNHQGRKMVSSVTTFENGKEGITKYIFYYNDIGQLIKIEVLRKGIVFFPNVGWVKDKTFRICNRMEYKNGTLQRTDYDEIGNVKKYYKYFYILDSDRYIIERTKINSSSDGNYLKWVRRFTYDYPYKDDIRQIIKETESSFVGNNVRGKIVEKEILADRYVVLYDIISGNTYRHDSNTKYDCAYNDLNINVCYLFDGLYDFERVTEWYNIYSECLIKEADNRKYRYSFTDKEPYNLYKIEKVNNDGSKVYETYLIEYVY